jgi:hypothetical protein
MPPFPHDFTIKARFQVHRLVPVFPTCGAGLATASTGSRSILDFAAQDAGRVGRILEEYQRDPGCVRSAGAAADLVRVLREIEQITSRLDEIEAEIVGLQSSEIALLMAKVETAKTRGRDLLAEMKRDVQHKIDLARIRFEALWSAARAG